MFKVSRRSGCSLLLTLFLGLAASRAQAQAPVQQTALDRQLAHVTLGIMGSGLINKTVSGHLSDGTLQTLDPSNTVGVLTNLSYVHSPLIGFEFNYSYARYNENFSNFLIPPGSSCDNIGCAGPAGVQTRVNEYTLGYVAHLPDFLGMTPFAAVGLGSTGFTPTKGGGQGLKAQARATYYYTFGVEKSVLSKHFGLRAEFHQVFFKAPDFGQNYLTIQAHTSTLAPSAGFFLRF
jgi:hypothetical protein